MPPAIKSGTNRLWQSSDIFSIFYDLVKITISAVFFPYICRGVPATIICIWKLLVKICWVNISCAFCVLYAFSSVKSAEILSKCGRLCFFLQSAYGGSSYFLYHLLHLLVKSFCWSFSCENWIFYSGMEFIYIFVSLISLLSIKYFSELKFLQVF